jgi:hypothetical protein
LVLDLVGDGAFDVGGVGQNAGQLCCARLVHLSGHWDTGGASRCPIRVPRHGQAARLQKFRPSSPTTATASLSEIAQKISPIAPAKRTARHSSQRPRADRRIADGHAEHPPSVRANANPPS